MGDVVARWRHFRQRGVTWLGHDGGMRIQDLADVQRLIDEKACEVAALEFKSDAPLDNREAKKKFARDVTSLGNIGGGTIIFGLKADDSTGVGIAQEITPIVNPSILSTMVDIINAAVRPPLLWNLTEFEAGAGRVVVAEVMPSSLGPYMVQGYGDNRYFRRSPAGVVEMTEFEVSSAYALAARSAEQRDAQWTKHFLPMTPAQGEPWLSIAALPFEPFLPIIEGREINSYQIVHPPAIGRCLFGLPIHQATVRHWADGITADDSLIGKPFTFAMRLHRDGAAGIVQKLEGFVDLRATARAVNAYLAYLADFWLTYSLRSAIELEVAIPGISKVRTATSMMGASPAGIVHPPGVEVAKVAISVEVLPWELTRASIRHAVVRQFIERLSYSFNWPYNGELFSYGQLFARGGVASGLLLGPGLIARGRPGGSNAVASIDQAGRVKGSSGAIKSFVVDGAVIDDVGDTLGVVEMTESFACPPDYLSNYSVAESSTAFAPWTEPTPDQGGPDVPSPTGKWSEKTINEAVA